MADQAIVVEGNANSLPKSEVNIEAPYPDAEATLWRWLDSVTVESERVRKEEASFDKFNEYIDMFYGKHWPSVLPSFRPPIVANELRTLILSEASDLSESQLRVYITKNGSQDGRDKMLERAFRAVWSRNFVDMELLYASMWALICGTGFIQVGWDPELAGGLGDILIEHRDPRTVLPDPDAIDDKKWQFVITETVLDLQDIRRFWPISGKRVKADDRYSLKDFAYAKTNGPQTAAYSGPLYAGSPYGSGQVGYKKARARVLDCLIKDPSVESVYEEVKDDQGQVIQNADGSPIYHETVKAKYPHGRRIVGSNGVILFDGDNPNPSGDFGIIRVILEPALGRFWSTGFVQQTAELQLAADKLLSSLVENAIRLNNGMMVATGNTGLDWESFAGIPGQILQINQGSEVKITYPPPMPPDMVQAPWKMLDLQRRLLGFQGARTGEGGRGNVSAELTETEISQSQSTTRLRARLLHNVVQRVAEMVFSRMAFNYTTPRIIPSVEGEKFEPIEWQPLTNPEKYSLYIDPASFMIMSKSMLKRLGTMLFKLRAIDRTSLLETIGWPDWAEIAKRLDRQDLAVQIATARKKAGQ